MPLNQGDVQAGLKKGNVPPQAPPQKPIVLHRSGTVVPASQPQQPVDEPPHPVLQQHGFNGGIQQFNQRVQAVNDNYQASYGQPPTPGLTLDLAKSPLNVGDFSKLFSVPKDPTAARARGALTSQGITPPANPVVTVKQLTTGILDAARKGTYQEYITQNHDIIRSFQGDQKDAAQISGALFKAKRLTTYREVETKLNNGDISPLDAHQQLQEAGFIPAGPVAKAVTGVGGFIAKAIGQVTDSLVHAPAGLYQIGRAAGLDTRDAIQHPERPGYQRTGKIVKATATSMKQDVEHPLRNPGYLFLDALGVASPLVEGGARVAEAGRIARAGEGLGEASKALVRKSPLQRVTVSHGSFTEEMPLSQNRLVAAMQKFIVNRRQSAADRALERGERFGALRSIIGTQTATKFFDDQLSFAKKVGREADARKRTDQIVRMTMARELDALAGRSSSQARMMSRVPGKIRGGLSRGEQKAIQIQSWDSLDPIGDERAFHQRMIEQGIGDVKAHKRQLADLKLAERALKNPLKRFQQALDLTRQVVAEMERAKIQDLGLLPETAEGRVARAGEVLRSENIGATDKLNEESFYLPTLRKGKTKRPPAEQAGYFPVKRGPYGVPLPRDLPEMTHQFTGEALRAGDYRIDATALASEAYARTVRALTVRAEHAKLWDAASNDPKSRFDIPIRDSQQIPDKLRELVSKLDEGDFSPADAEALPPDMRGLIEELYPTVEKIKKEQIQGVRWIDGRLLGEGSKLPHQPGLAAHVSQAFQSPLRFTMLYLRPAYILNKLGNHAMLWLDQGIHTVPNFIRAMAGDSLYGEENMRTIHELVGAGKSRSFVASSSGKFSTSVANFWNRVADRDERATAFIYYMRRKGYTTKEDVTRLMNDQKARADLNEIKRRANKSLVEFDNLLPIEKDYIRHLIFVYPWVSRSAVYSIRAILEHPTKAAILSQLGRQDMENDPIFKNAPEWFKTTGYVPIGWNHDGTPRVVNPTSVNTFSTLGDFLSLTRAATKGDKYGSAEDFLGPFPKFLVHAITGRDQYGNQYPGSQWAGAAKEVLLQLPQLSALEKSKQKPKPGGGPIDVSRRASLEASLNKNLHATVFSPGWLDGFGSMLVGGLSPREVNMPALAARYWQDATPEKRHARELDLLNRALNIQGERLGRSVPPGVRSAVADQANIEYQYKLFLKKTGRTPTDKERANFTVSYLKKQGLISDTVASNMEAQLKNEIDPTEINRIKNTLLDKYANGKALRAWDEDVRNVSSFTKPTFDEKVRGLFAQGLVDQKQYNASQEKLFDYGRKYVAFTHEVKKLQASGASALQLKAFEDAHDQPVDGLPSFVRIAWANQPQTDQQQHIDSITTASWSSLSAFDKSLLGVKTDPKITAGWAKLHEIETMQRKELAREGRTFPSSYARILAKYVEKYYDAPGLTRDFDFSKQPLYTRLKYLKPIQNSPNRGLWTQLLNVAGDYGKYLSAKSADGSRAYNATQVRQMWRDYTTSKGFQAWLGEHPDFRAEVQSLGKNTLSKLIG